MSRLTEYGKKSHTSNPSEVENYMGGKSYRLNPLDTLRIVASSAIFGEPQYYRDGLKSPAKIKESLIFPELFEAGDAVEVFSRAIDNSLTFDFRQTLELALQMRTLYNMRLNPSIIFVRASMHPLRKDFNQKNPGFMREIGKKISIRPDDLSNQFDYFKFVNGKKNGLSSLLKRTWADALESYSRYQINKYKGKSLIDLVRISHANSSDIDELMAFGKLSVTDEEKTWETLRSAGDSWSEILKKTRVPHMALLRNLRGIFTEIKDLSVANKILEDLKAGVLGGKQFPFRYFSAYSAIQSATEIHFQTKILDALEECLDISLENMPKLSGKVVCLSDNSGSAHGTTNSEYGSVRVSEIANLSSLITASMADDGYVGVFGDNLSIKQVSKRNGILNQLKETNDRGLKQGQGTENGIWIFWKEAIENKIHYDTVFIYSDMQAGHGGLYGIDPNEYREFIHESSRRNIDVITLVKKYREEVNPKVNVFSVQVAGYDNTILPENLYRGAILSGWTGKESIFASEIINLWNSVEDRK